MKKKIIVSSSILLMIPFLLYLFLSIVGDSTFSVSFLSLALIAILGMIITEKDNYMFAITFFIFISSGIGIFAEIMDYFM